MKKKLQNIDNEILLLKEKLSQLPQLTLKYEAELKAIEIKHQQNILELNLNFDIRQDGLKNDIFNVKTECEKIKLKIEEQENKNNSLQNSRAQDDFEQKKITLTKQLQENQEVYEHKKDQVADLKKDLEILAPSSKQDPIQLAKAKREEVAKLRQEITLLQQHSDAYQQTFRSIEVAEQLKLALEEDIQKVQLSLKGLPIDTNKLQQIRKTLIPLRVQFKRAESVDRALSEGVVVDSLTNSS